ncbi:MAG: hypothetical protein AAF223_17235, partial [Bacteroidota bacterium]
PVYFAYSYQIENNDFSELGQYRLKVRFAGDYDFQLNGDDAEFIEGEIPFDITNEAIVGATINVGPEFLEGESVPITFLIQDPDRNFFTDSITITQEADAGIINLPAPNPSSLRGGLGSFNPSTNTESFTWSVEPQDDGPLSISFSVSDLNSSDSDDASTTITNSPPVIVSVSPSATVLQKGDSFDLSIISNDNGSPSSDNSPSGNITAVQVANGTVNDVGNLIYNSSVDAANFMVTLNADDLIESDESDTEAATHNIVVRVKDDDGSYSVWRNVDQFTYLVAPVLNSPSSGVASNYKFNDNIRYDFDLSNASFIAGQVSSFTRTFNIELTSVFLGQTVSYEVSELPEGEDAFYRFTDLSPGNYTADVTPTVNYLLDNGARLGISGTPQSWNFTVDLFEYSLDFVSSSSAGDFEPISPTTTTLADGSSFNWFSGSSLSNTAITAPTASVYEWETVFL